MSLHYLVFFFNFLSNRLKRDVLWSVHMLPVV